MSQISSPETPDGFGLRRSSLSPAGRRWSCKRVNPPLSLHSRFLKQDAQVLPWQMQKTARRWGEPQAPVLTTKGAASMAFTDMEVAAAQHAAAARNAVPSRERRRKMARAATTSGAVKSMPL